MRKFFAALTVFSLMSTLIELEPSRATAQTPSAPIVFFDIAGPNAGKLKAFYASNFGWDIDSSNAIATPGLRGTLREDPAETLIYLGVKDINSVLSSVIKSGGTVVLPRTVVPKVVVFAIFKDPAGNRMGLVEQK